MRQHTTATPAKAKHVRLAITPSRRAAAPLLPTTVNPPHSQIALRAVETVSTLSQGFRTVRLFLCEKPSQGRDIARVLGANQRAAGCLRGAGFVVTWCIGHLVETAEPDAYGEHYRRWSIDHLPIIPSEWRVSVKASTEAQFKVVQDLIASATVIVIATDADREGEMIAREILDLCAYTGPVQRLWLSALNDASIRKALGELRPGTQTVPLYHAALARSRADWLVGMNLSRLFTLLARQAGHDGVLAVGRVQTPTLQLVVQRDRAIESFVAAPYWAIDVQLIAAADRFHAQWIAPKESSDDVGRCVQQAVAQQAADQIRRASEAKVLTVETTRIREAPPLPFSLSTLQETCSRQYGFDAKETLDTVQALYESHKAVTYPRTDCGFLPTSMIDDIPAVLGALVATDPAVQPLVDKLDRSQRSRAWDDSKVSAHHGIIPTVEPARLSSMSKKDEMVYRLIRSHYLAQFFPVHEWDRTIAEISIGDRRLRATGKQIVSQGWRIAIEQMLDGDVDSEHRQPPQLLPKLRTDARCSIAGVELKSLKTQPPKLFTQGELISAMKNISRFVADPRLKRKLNETSGIGTEATRAGMIEGLLSRKYLLKRGRAIQSSSAARILCAVVPDAILNPGTTAIWEQALDLVASGQMTLDAFVSKQSEWVSMLVREYAHRPPAIKVSSGPPCPLCAASTRQRGGKNGSFWSCTRYPECRGSLPLDHRKSSSPARRKSK